MDKKKLEALREKYQKELQIIQQRINEATATLNQLQVAYIDRRGKLEVIEELLKESENK